MFENNLLSILSFASTRSTWVSASSCAQLCKIDYDNVYKYLSRDDFGQVAEFYHYEYRIRRRFDGRLATHYISVVNRGYA